MPNAQKKIKIINKLGLHVRAATQLVKLAESFPCDIRLERPGFDAVNGKSIMSVLTLAAPLGTEVTVTTDGERAPEALQAIEALFADRFGEDQ